jgi:hypothetical protein
MEIARHPMPMAGGARFGRMKTIILQHRLSSRGLISTEKGGCDSTLGHSDCKRILYCCDGLEEQNA